MYNKSSSISKRISTLQVLLVLALLGELMLFGGFVSCLIWTVCTHKLARAVLFLDFVYLPSHIYTRCLSLYLFLSLTHTLSHTHTHKYSHDSGISLLIDHARTHAHTHAHTRTHTHTHTRISLLIDHTRIHTHTLQS